METAKSTYIPPPAIKPKSSLPQNSRKKRQLEETATGRVTKRSKIAKDADNEPAVELVTEQDTNTQAFKQPTLVTGAKLKDYQLEGVAWMAGLYQNGISGILGGFGDLVPYDKSLIV
jgi:ATP-dependent DNA helicase